MYCEYYSENIMIQVKYTYIRTHTIFHTHFNANERCLRITTANTKKRTPPPILTHKTKLDSNPETQKIRDKIYQFPTTNFAQTTPDFG